MKIVRYILMAIAAFILLFSAAVIVLNEGRVTNSIYILLGSALISLSILVSVKSRSE